jgi:hypothetical protein
MGFDELPPVPPDARQGVIWWSIALARTKGVSDPPPPEGAHTTWVAWLADLRPGGEGVARSTPPLSDPDWLALQVHWQQMRPASRHLVAAMAEELASLASNSMR